MSEHAQMGAGGRAASSGTSRGQSADSLGSAPSASLGWVGFAGVMMVLLGVFNVIEGLVALFKNSYYVVAPNGLLVFNLTGWGWIHLGIGILEIAAGLALFSGASWARVVAVILVSVNAIDQLAFLSAHPVWATIIIALDVVVVWAVVVHGGEARAVSSG